MPRQIIIRLNKFIVIEKRNNYLSVSYSKNKNGIIATEIILKVSFKIETIFF